MAGKDEEKQHKRRWRKSRTGSGEDSSETELRRSSKSLSVTREKYRRSKASQADIALKVPDFEDYKDLMNDDTAGGPELEEPEGLSYPKRTKSDSQGQTKSARAFAQAAPANPQALSPVAGPTALSREKSMTRSKPRISDAGGARASEGGEKPLPRLLAPRTSVAELMAAANKAAPSPAPEGQAVETEELAEVSAVSFSSETSPLKSNSAEPKRKKSHSALGHLWKTIKNDLLNPKAAAPDFQKLSVSAVRQATVVMSSVAENAEAEITNLHDQLLGGKRNLPDHPAKPLPSARSQSAKVATNPASPQPAIIVAVRADSSIESKATPTASSSWTPHKIAAQHSATASELSKAAQPVGNSSNPAWPASEAPLLSKPQSQKSLKSRAGPGTSSNEAAAASTSKTEPEAVERSRGSAYMLSKYEDEPESPRRLAESLSRTAEVIAQGTAQMLTGANYNAVYLKRLLMCGLGGRAK